MVISGLLMLLQDNQLDVFGEAFQCHEARYSAQDSADREIDLQLKKGGYHQNSVR